MTQRKNYLTGAPWEPIVGYSRAVRVGQFIEVSGTVSIKDGKLYGGDDMGLQTRRILEIIDESLAALGARREDVIRTRMYVTDISRWEEAAKEHGKHFEGIQPATSMVEVSALIDPGYLIEVEATALIS
jgi:enamine deaminase RidA (YjgF/YER057c/UK114 family)